MPVALCGDIERIFQINYSCIGIKLCDSTTPVKHVMFVFSRLLLPGCMRSVHITFFTYLNLLLFSVSNFGYNVLINTLYKL